jgi:hypothetical protein
LGHLQQLGGAPKVPLIRHGNKAAQLVQRKHDPSLAFIDALRV